MKYLKDKNTRRRGVAMEMAIMVLLVLTLLSTITVSTATILINKQSSAQKEFTDKIERYKYDYLGEVFFTNIKIETEEDRIEPSPTIVESVQEVLNTSILENAELYTGVIAVVNEVQMDLEDEKNYSLEVIDSKSVTVLTVIVSVKCTIPLDTETEVTPGAGNDEGEGSNPTDDNTGDNTSQVTEEPTDDPNEGTGEGDQTNSETVTYIYTIISWEYQ